ncbi:MAG: glycosyltransferase family 4 protein [Nitrospirae bacterium]|nr:glycosyltransferase family 4 protein [Nitrospirota bacterium]
MNILHTETLKKWGGQQNRVLMESIGLQQRGHRIVIACHRGSVLAGKAKAAGLRVYEMNMSKRFYVPNILKLIRVIKTDKIDIVSTHSSVDSWTGGIAAKLTNTKLVRFRHNLYTIRRGPLAKFIYAIPDKIIAISPVIKDLLTRYGINDDKLLTICSSVDIKRFDAGVEDIRKEMNLPEDVLVIGNTSSFVEAKGQEYLMQAFNIIGRTVPCILLFAGRVSDEKKNRMIIHIDNDLRDRVMFIGHRDDIPRVVKVFDVFVFASWVEGLGTSLIEAMTMGRTVAVSDIPTFRDFVEDGNTGLFFKVKDPKAIAEKVISLLKDKQMRERLGRNARAAALERFSYDRMTDRTEAMYREVLNAS